MKSVIYIFLLVFLASTVVFGQSGNSISGIVTVSNSGDILHQASVRIVELNRTAISNDVGTYSFSDVPPGNYTLVAHQEGFADMKKNITVAAGTNPTVDFQMQIRGIKEDVTVTASGSEQSTFDAIESVSTVDSNAIREHAAVGIGEILEGQSGVAKRSFGPGNSRPVIRGFDGDRVLVSSDGVRSGSLASQSGDHAEPIDTLALERIEIVKGPATLLYGSSAIGGVVNAISGHDEGAHPGTRGYFSAIGGSNSGQAAISGGIEHGFRNWNFWGNGTTQRTGDYTAGGEYGKVKNSFTRSSSGTAGLGYFGSKAFITVNDSYYQNRYGIPLDLTEVDPEIRSLRAHRNEAKTTFGYNDSSLFVSGIKFTLDFSNYQHQEMDANEVGTTFLNNVYSYRGSFNQRQDGKLSGSFGFEGFHRYFSTIGDETLISGPVKHDSFSIFALEELKYERVTLQFGGRIENNRLRPDNPALPKRSFTGSSGAAGARFALWDGGAFVANYTHSNRAPAIEELYNFGPHDGTLSFEVGNNALKAERSDGIDFALRQQSKRVRAEATYYYYKLKNFVFLVPTGVIDENSGLEIANYLQGNSRFTGTELSLDYTAHQNLNILTGLDYVNAQLTDGRPLPRIAPLRARIGLDYHPGNLSIRPEFVAVGSQNRVFGIETPTAGYGVFNIAASYILPTQHTASIFSVNAYNLGNKLYYNHISFIKDISPEIGRGIRFSYTLRFF